MRSTMNTPDRADESPSLSISSTEPSIPVGGLQELDGQFAFMTELKETFLTAVAGGGRTTDVIHTDAPSVPMKVRHLSRGIFRLEGAEGSSHSCPCSRSRLIQQVAPSRSVCADRRLYRRHALRHPNSPIARGDGRSLPRTSCAS